MKLNEQEQGILAGAEGRVAQIALQHQIKVGDFFGAADFVPVTQAHIMADTESLGEAGVRWLESLASEDGGRGGVRIPTITDPRGTDFAKAGLLRQAPWMLSLEQRAIDAFVRLGVSMTDTCINYQTIQAPTRGEHLAFGDTGVVIYSNSVCGARSNFEGGPSALAAGITGRTPRYGFHLDAQRRATVRFRVEHTPTSLNDWGALGGVIGRLAGNYWSVPVVEGLEGAPGSDALKHFGAAMASFGSIALFHLVGITPEAARLDDVGGERLPVAHRIGAAELRALHDGYALERRDRRRRLLGTAAEPVRAAPDRRAVRRPALHQAAARGDEPAGQARRRPHGLHRAHRGGGRPGALGHVLLSVVCARDRRGERLEAARHQQRQAGQHPRRLRLRADDRVDGALRRRGRDREAGMSGVAPAQFEARHAIGSAVRGTALVAHDGFSARYDLDRIAGVFSRPAHKLAGQSYVGRVLVLDTAKGGVASAWMLHEMASRGVVPLAIVFNTVNPILAQGAAFGEIAMLAGFDVDITAEVPHGAMVEVDPARRLLRIVAA